MEKNKRINWYRYMRAAPKSVEEMRRYKGNVKLTRAKRQRE